MSVIESPLLLSESQTWCTSIRRAWIRVSSLCGSSLGIGRDSVGVYGFQKSKSGPPALTETGPIRIGKTATQRETRLP